MNSFRSVLLFSLITFSTFGHTALELPLLFSDGMVLQRNQRIHVWGWSDPGTTVNVQLDRQHARTQTAEDGSWHAYLPEFKAGGPYVLSINTDVEKRSIKDVLIGDVWLCSGQSNMEFMLKQAMKAPEEIANADDKRLRHFKIPRSWAMKPEKQLAGGEWQTTSPETAGDFTAVGYFFARELRKKTGVPIGLINSSWGGSRIEPWMSGNSLNMDADVLDKQLQSIFEREKKTMLAVRQKLAQWPKSEGGLVGGKALWADPGLDDGDWAVITVPALWETQGFNGMDGIAWYRTTFRLTASEAKKGITLSLGPIDDSDQTWINAKPVGEMAQAWNKPRNYTVPAKYLRPGSNTIAVRVEDTGGGGGIYGNADQIFFQITGGESRSLAGKWKFKPDQVTVGISANVNHIETLLYNKMIYPLQPYAIKGVIWYQGESNATVEDAYQYRFLFQDMIQSWRDEWRQKNMPFLWVQLANFISNDDGEWGSPWAVLRESQSTALSLPNTAEAVIIDIGDANDIHPRNKQDVGHRLALAARHLVYGEKKLVYSGPRLRSYRIKDNSVKLKFQHTGKGLKSRDSDTLKGFSIAAGDRKFVHANAVIKGDNVVVVSHPDIDHPVAVRYAWSDNPEQANLINSEGLPASPFRTDDWEVLEPPEEEIPNM